MLELWPAQRVLQARAGLSGRCRNLLAPPPPVAGPVQAAVLEG